MQAVTQDVEELAPSSEEFETTDLLQEPGDFPSPIADTHGDAVFSLSAPVQEEAEKHEPILSLEQGLTAVGDGQYTQTIVVRCGGSEKRFVLTLGLTIE
ncbi:hypothetical protein FDZ71_12775 [bacterium]|nr:MAG: hypothetical protein FDZ71_12775 [bacterium]